MSTSLFINAIKQATPSIIEFILESTSPNIHVEDNMAIRHIISLKHRPIFKMLLKYDFNREFDYSFLVFIIHQIISENWFDGYDALIECTEELHRRNPEIRKIAKKDIAYTVLNIANEHFPNGSIQLREWINKFKAIPEFVDIVANYINEQYIDSLITGANFVNFIIVNNYNSLIDIKTHLNAINLAIASNNLVILTAIVNNFFPDENLDILFKRDFLSIALATENIRTEIIDVIVSKQSNKFAEEHLDIAIASNINRHDLATKIATNLGDKFISDKFIKSIIQNNTYIVEKLLEFGLVSNVNTHTFINTKIICDDGKSDYIIFHTTFEMLQILVKYGFDFSNTIDIAIKSQNFDFIYEIVTKFRYNLYSNDNLILNEAVISRNFTFLKKIATAGYNINYNNGYIFNYYITSNYENVSEEYMQNTFEFLEFYLRHIGGLFKLIESSTPITEEYLQSVQGKAMISEMLHLYEITTGNNNIVFDMSNEYLQKYVTSYNLYKFMQRYYITQQNFRAFLRPIIHDIIIRLILIDPIYMESNNLLFFTIGLTIKIYTDYAQKHNYNYLNLLEFYRNNIKFPQRVVKSIKYLQHMKYVIAINPIVINHKYDSENEESDEYFHIAFDAILNEKYNFPSHIDIQLEVNFFAQMYQYVCGLMNIGNYMDGIIQIRELARSKSDNYLCATICTYFAKLFAKLQTIFKNPNQVASFLNIIDDCPERFFEFIQLLTPNIDQLTNIQIIFAFSPDINIRLNNGTFIKYYTHLLKTADFSKIEDYDIENLDIIYDYLTTTQSFDLSTIFGELFDFLQELRKNMSKSTPIHETYRTFYDKYLNIIKIIPYKTVTYKDRANYYFTKYFDKFTNIVNDIFLNCENSNIIIDRYGFPLNNGSLDKKIHSKCIKSAFIEILCDKLASFTHNLSQYENDILAKFKTIIESHYIIAVPDDLRNARKIEEIVTGNILNILNVLAMILTNKSLTSFEYGINILINILYSKHSIDFVSNGFSGGMLRQIFHMISSEFENPVSVAEACKIFTACILEYAPTNHITTYDILRDCCNIFSEMFEINLIRNKTDKTVFYFYRLNVWLDHMKRNHFVTGEFNSLFRRIEHLVIAKIDSHQFFEKLLDEFPVEYLPNFSQYRFNYLLRYAIRMNNPDLIHTMFYKYDLNDDDLTPLELAKFNQIYKIKM